MSVANPSALPANLPHSLSQAAWRGMRGSCPRCDGARLFRRWLKPVDACAACSQDWSLHKADDLPPYISIFVTGHLLAPLIISLIATYEFSTLGAFAVILPLAVVMMLGILQPAKGAVIALQYWMGMAGFHKERRAELQPEPEAGE